MDEALITTNLLMEGVPRTAFKFGQIAKKDNDLYGIANDGAQWRVYYAERGKESVLLKTGVEKEAVEYFIERLTRTPHVHDIAMVQNSFALGPVAEALSSLGVSAQVDVQKRATGATGITVAGRTIWEAKRLLGDALPLGDRDLLRCLSISKVPLAFAIATLAPIVEKIARPGGSEFGHRMVVDEKYSMSRTAEQLIGLLAQYGVQAFLDRPSYSKRGCAVIVAEADYRACLQLFMGRLPLIDGDEVELCETQSDGEVETGPDLVVVARLATQPELDALVEFLAEAQITTKIAARKRRDGTTCLYAPRASSDLIFSLVGEPLPLTRVDDLYARWRGAKLPMSFTILRMQSAELARNWIEWFAKYGISLRLEGSRFPDGTVGAYVLEDDIPRTLDLVGGLIPLVDGDCQVPSSVVRPVPAP